MPFPEGSGQGEVGDQGQVSGEGQGEHEAHLESGDAGSEHEEGHQAARPARMVPLSEHVQQRKQYQTKLREAEQRHAALEARLARLESRGSGDQEELTPDQKKWREWTGVSKLEKQVELLQQELAKRGGVDPELEARLERAESAANVATDAYFTELENQARAAYNPKEIPLTRTAWEKVVAAEMSPQETFAIMRGDRETYRKVIARAKAIFKPAGSINRPLQTQRDSERLRTAPRVPGPGGAPAPAPAPERVTGRKLHERAHSIFSAAFDGSER